MPTGDQIHCPIVDYRYVRGPEPAGSNFARLDDLRRHGPIFRSEEGSGYWVFTEHDAILEVLQDADSFSSRSVSPLEPNPPYKFIPMNLDPPEHGKWRHLLGLYFSPGRVRGLKDEQRKFARDLIEGFADRGSCEYYEEFAAIFPTTIFLQLMGLPIDELPHFMNWEDKILHANEHSDPDHSVAIGAMMEIMGYFSELLNHRRTHPESRGDDIVSHAIDWRIDGEPPTDADLLSCMLLLFMAGLDTVASQLSYTMLHLATHDADRARIASDPAVIPTAIEELMRAYPIVQTARKAQRDMTFRGCPIKKGDMLEIPLAMANRDPKEHPRAGLVDLDAPKPRHIDFGAGVHRCLGSHLARQEMTVVLEEWHRLIPDYQLADRNSAKEHTGGVYGIDSLPLSWPV